MMSLAVLLSRARVALGLAVLLAAAPALQAQSTVVRIATTQGNLDLRLLDEAVPRTVVNFIAYLRAGSYKDNMFHRSARSTPAGGVEGPFVIQGGGYRWTQSDLTPVAVTKNNPVANEFAATRSNLRGTVAMAKIGGNPNSATNEWFVNLSDNTSLDTQNGGFTVFAQVSSDGMGVADRIAALARYNAGGAFNEMPVTMTEIRDFAALRDAAVLITEVIEYPSKATATDADRIRPPRGRTVVVGAGKAGGAMAAALDALWPADAPLKGLVVTRYGMCRRPGGAARPHRGRRGRAPGARRGRPQRAAAA
jgi:peptidyl-prolyl cis-trans isomerase A (cyclophilin A)